jgi:hypothetical protein
MFWLGDPGAHLVALEKYSPVKIVSTSRACTVIYQRADPIGELITSSTPLHLQPRYFYATPSNCNEQ